VTYYDVSFLNFSYMLDGVPEMRERPISDLVIGPKQLGADVDIVSLALTAHLARKVNIKPWMRYILL
jgi:5-enolpyruvylshikimate-3-phosphate synthase